MEGFSWLTQYWHQILALGILVVWATRTKEKLSEVIKDLDSVTRHLEKVSDNAETTAKDHIRLQANYDANLTVMQKNITSLWQIINSMRDRELDKR
mgnify:CR=1 FL=1